jgi:hypothetical protein
MTKHSPFVAKRPTTVRIIAWGPPNQQEDDLGTPRTCRNLAGANASSAACRKHTGKPGMPTRRRGIAGELPSARARYTEEDESVDLSVKERAGRLTNVLGWIRETLRCG